MHLEVLYIGRITPSNYHHFSYYYSIAKDPQTPFAFLIASHRTREAAEINKRFYNPEYLVFRELKEENIAQSKILKVSSKSSQLQMDF